MRRALTLATLLALAGSSVAATYAPDDPCADEAGYVSYPAQQVWFTANQAKVNNAAGPDGWDTTAPTDSVQAGAGGGALSAMGSAGSLVPEAPQSATFAGTFEGCLDTLLVEMYAFQPTNRTGTSGSLAESPHNFSLRLTIDGTPLEATGPQVAVTEANPGGTATYRLRFQVADIRTALEDYGVTGTDLAGSHDIGFEITAWFANTNNTVYVWDTTEVPATMTFNGTGTVAEYGTPITVF